MPRTCTACQHPRRDELDRRLRSGASLPDTSRWTRDNGPEISVSSLQRHRADHVALVAMTRPGPRPVSDDFLALIRDTVQRSVEEGWQSPSVRDGLAAQAQIDARLSRNQDRDFAAKLAIILFGDRLPEPRPVTAYESALQKLATGDDLDASELAEFAPAPHPQIEAVASGARTRGGLMPPTAKERVRLDD